MIKTLLRRVGTLLLLALVVSPSLVLGQEETTITVVGSAIVSPILQALVDASEVEADFQITTTGTSSGMEAFCSGQADIATANRPISASEDTDCATNAVDYVELLIGHEIVTVITHPDNELTQCLTAGELSTIFAPSAAGQTINWNQLNAESADTPLTVNLPEENTVIYAILDQQIEGDGLRADATILESDADIVEAVGQDSGALGVVSLEAAVAAGDSVKILELDNADVTGCAAPSADAVENRLYLAANRLFVYVNRASLDKPGLRNALEFAVSEDAADVITALGVTPPTSNAYATDREVLAGTAESRPFSEETTAFDIPQGLIGQINIGGAANGYTYVQSMADTFTGAYQGVTIDVNIEGQPAGFRRLCNGEIDIAISYSNMSEEQAQNCAANNIALLTIDLGSQATVLVANTASEYLHCLTTDQIVTIWGAAAENTIVTWNQVSADFPVQAMTLFAPNAGNSYTDLMLLKAADSGIPNRVDTELDDDPLYRAAATANVEGALTYMSWTEYQQVLDSDQPNIALVAVDSGSGCVVPSPESIADSTYALARPAKLIVNQASLAKIEVESFLWFLASDANYALLEESGFIGVSFSDLAAIRTLIQNAASQAQAAVQAEATEEPGVETTEEAGEATEEAMIGATETPVPDAEATAEATEEAPTEANGS